MLLQHAFGLFTHPHEEWQSIKREHAGPLRLYVAYISVLGLIAPVCAFISTTQFGWQVGEGQLIKLTTTSALQLSVLTYIAMLVGVFAIGYMIDWMAKTYGAKRDHHAANGVALMAYACTPLFIAGFALLYPVPWFNMIIFLAAAAYAGYLLYDGLPIVLNISEEKAFLFEGSILAVALVYLVLTRIGTVIIWNLGFNPVFISG